MNESEALESLRNLRFTASTQQGKNTAPVFEQEAVDRRIGIVSTPLSGPRLWHTLSSPFV